MYLSAYSKSPGLCRFGYENFLVKADFAHAQE